MQKQQFDDGLKNIDPRLKELERREKEFSGREKAVESAMAELKKKWDGFDAERRVQEVRLQQRDQDLARREVELAARELAARELAAAAEQACGRYQTDLIRVDRLPQHSKARRSRRTARRGWIAHEQFQPPAANLRSSSDFRRPRRAPKTRTPALQLGRGTGRPRARLNGRIAEIETR